MTIARIARFGVRADAVGEAESAIAEFTAAVGTEPGTRLYVSYQSEKNPTQFVHFMVFDDAAAEEAHGSTEHVKRFTSRLYPLTTAPVDFSEWRVVASAGGVRT